MRIVFCISHYFEDTVMYIMRVSIGLNLTLQKTRIFVFRAPVLVCRTPIMTPLPVNQMNMKLPKTL